MVKDHHSDNHHKGGIGFYVFVGLVLAVITYIEFAIVEYEIAWLNRTWIFILLAVLSLVKFFMVIWFFMHLKDDNKTYTGFFSSGMVIAMGTFIALAALFTVRSAVNVREGHAEEVVAHGEASHGEEHSVEIPERAFADTLRVPQPKSQVANVEVPKAEANTFSFTGFGGAVPSNDAVNDAVPTDETSEPESITETEEAAAETTVSAEAETASRAEPDSSNESELNETTAETTTEATTTDTETTSSEATPTDVATTGAVAASNLSAQAGGDWDRALGEQVYSNCIACHQEDGQGVPNAFPPQAGHAADIYNVEGGRAYMIDTVLWGLQGEIKVDGKTYNGIMTPWSSFLKDEQIAAVVNYVLTSWGNDALLEDFTPITPEEVAAERATTMTAQEVYESRAALGLPE
ncbi:MAG: c-type cytochrome [Trueperaceae bacterium]